MKITTKTGDKGETSLFGGRRVRKDSLFIELVGEVDELQAFIGLCKVCDGVSDEVRDSLEKIIDDLYRIMSILGFELKVPGNIEGINDEDVEFLDSLIENGVGKAEDTNVFVRPGASEKSARFHVARCVCRRAERSLVKANIDGAEEILKYLNRLSDVLFVFSLMA